MNPLDYVSHHHLSGSVVRGKPVVPSPLDAVDRELEQRGQVGHHGGVVGVHVQGRREHGAAKDVGDIVSREDPGHVGACDVQLDVIVVG